MMCVVKKIICEVTHSNMCEVTTLVTMPPAPLPPSSCQVFDWRLWARLLQGLPDSHKKVCVDGGGRGRPACVCVCVSSCLCILISLCVCMCASRCCVWASFVCMHACVCLGGVGLFLWGGVCEFVSLCFSVSGACGACVCCVLPPPHPQVGEAEGVTAEGAERMVMCGRPPPEVTARHARFAAALCMSRLVGGEEGGRGGR